jgi:hypothetical protein
MRLLRGIAVDLPWEKLQQANQTIDALANAGERRKRVAKP